MSFVASQWRCAPTVTTHTHIHIHRKAWPERMWYTRWLVGPPHAPGLSHWMTFPNWWCSLCFHTLYTDTLASQLHLHIAPHAACLPPSRHRKIAIAFCNVLILTALNKFSEWWMKLKLFERFTMHGMASGVWAQRCGLCSLLHLPLLRVNPNAYTSNSTQDDVCIIKWWVPLHRGHTAPHASADCTWNMCLCVPKTNTKITLMW